MDSTLVDSVRTTLEAELSGPLAASSDIAGRSPFRFHRVTLGDRRCVVKMTGGLAQAHAIASLRHEYEILHAVDLRGVVRVLELTETADGLMLVMEDAGPQNLSGRLRVAPLSIGQFLEVATQLAETLASLHEMQVLHRNISPTNVVWNDEERRATLVDFGMAITLSSVAVESVSPTQLEGNLAYGAPEQTGRTGRSVDSRSDLYSLGVTFYELLTGSPPFVTQDPVEQIHAHLARRPRPPHETHPAIPVLLSRIVLKLLQKEPEQRYQTANALLSDLRNARAQWDQKGTVAPFEIAYRDVSRMLRIPDKLYGRAKQVQVLHDAYARASSGRREVVLVTGDPGIGKSALVNHLQQPVLERRGLFISGKFDQLQRGVPYSGLVQAFRMLVRELLTGSETELARWRERVLTAVAPNAQVLIDMVPELERVVGPQPPVPELGPLEAKNRFNFVLTSFLHIFAQPEHPFALFLDDLQWIDAASLRLLEQWATDENRHFLLVGSYRDTEIGPGHPLAESLGAWRTQGAASHEIHLGPLTREDVTQLVMDTFGRGQDHARPLAELVVRKTAGNPFFVRRLLHTLHLEQLIRFDARVRAWEWSLDDVAQAPISDNVVELMTQSLNRLPSETQQLLQASACVGHRFDLGLLAEITDQSRTTVMDRLWPAMEDGLLVPLRETYKTPRQAGPLDQQLNDLPGGLQFVHDRVQQAAYAMLSDERRERLHLSIGRRMLQGLRAEKLDEALFDIVDQLDLGEPLIVAPEERLTLAQLNLAAGRKAKASAAYQATFDYLAVARRHLPERAWETGADLAFAVHRELAEAAYLTGRHVEAEELTRVGIEHAPTKVAKLALYSLRATAACAAGDNARGLRAGREGLSLFGLEWPTHGLAQAIEAESEAVVKNLGVRRIEALADEPEPRDEEVRACIRLLSVLGPPAYFSDSQVLAFVVTRLTNLSLIHGPSEYSAYGYTFYGALHLLRTGDYETGYAFGQLALALARRFGNRGEESRTVQVFGLIVSPWKAPLRTTMPLFRDGHLAASETGELLYVALNLCALLIHGLALGRPLSELEADVGKSFEFATRHHNQTSLELTLPYRQIVRCLTGRTRTPGSLEDAEFDEARFLEGAKENLTALAFYWINRLEATYLAGDYAEAQRSATQATQWLPAAMGMIREAELVFYGALTNAALCRQRAAPERAALRTEVQIAHRKLAAWASHCPENFRHKEQVIAAELAELSGDSWAAVKLYRAALEGAERERFLQDRAIIAERLGEFLLAEGDVPSGFAYLRLAREEYAKWGATQKVRLLERAHPGLRTSVSQTVGQSDGPLRLDALGLIKASQAIAAETDLEKLVESILSIVVEVAGAEKGTLLTNGPGGLVVRGRAVSKQTITASLAQVPLDECPETPQALVRYVQRIGEPLVLADAVADSPFTTDPTIQRRQLRSILCVPLKQQSEVVGVLYLENNALNGAFTEERVEVVQVLAAQAVISLENSTLLLERERAERMARFLADAGAMLIESLDYATTLTRVLRLAVPVFADWSLLDLIEDGGRVRRIEVVHADPSQAGIAEGLREFSARTDERSDHPPSQALSQGRPILVEHISAERLKELTLSAEHHRLAQRVQPRSIISVPLVARGRTLGVITFATAQSGRDYDRPEVETAWELARRCALAMDNSGLYKDAQNAIRIREEFLSIASHELKTPLTPLQLLIPTIERRLPRFIANEEDKVWAQQKLGTLRRQSQRLERLINELLDIPRMSHEQLRLELELEPVNLSEELRQVVKRSEENGDTTRSGSHVTVDAPRDVIGRWDRQRLKQVINNVFSNALKYGEGKPVEIAARSEADMATLVVTDHGLGIAPEHLKRIFERFERAVSPNHYGGLGLGLFITSEILKAMDGSIVAHSKLGQGSSFVVTLPLRMPSARTGQHA